MPLIMNALGDGHTDTHTHTHTDTHTDTHTHTHTHTHTRIPTHKPKQFQGCAPGLKRGIGIKNEKHVNKLEIKKYGNKLKMEFSDHRTNG